MLQDVGVVVGAVLNLQVGVTMHKARFVTPFNRMKDGMALPIGWISIVSVFQCEYLHHDECRLLSNINGLFIFWPSNKTILHLNAESNKNIH